MKHSVEDLIGIVYQYYPRNVLSTEPHLGTSMEYQRLIAARKRAGADKGTWQALLKRVGTQFPGQLVQDHSLGLLGGGYGASYYAELYLPEPSGKYEHSIGFAVSFLVPYYALFSSRLVERVRQQRLLTGPTASTIFEGDTCVILPGEKSLTHGSADEMEKHREFSFSFASDELSYAESLGREIELLFGCQRLPPELASVIVPDISTSLREIGLATIFDCLFSDQY